MIAYFEVHFVFEFLYFEVEDDVDRSFDVKCQNTPLSIDIRLLFLH